VSSCRLCLNHRRFRGRDGGVLYFLGLYRILLAVESGSLLDHGFTYASASLPGRRCDLTEKQIEISVISLWPVTSTPNLSPMLGISVTKRRAVEVYTHAERLRILKPMKLIHLPSLICVAILSACATPKYNYQPTAHRMDRPPIVSPNQNKPYNTQRSVVPLYFICHYSSELTAHAPKTRNCLPINALRRPSFLTPPRSTT
jgi:hypothetical protein